MWRQGNLTGFGPIGCGVRHRADKNADRILADLERLGFLTANTSQLGRGFPDAVIMKRGTREMRLLEIKNPEGAKNLTPHEKGFIEIWGDAVIVASTVDEVLEAFNGA